jgi:hypothetical protein
MTPASDRSWHLDRRVPIALILTIAMQTGGVIWWASATSTRLDALEKKVEAAAPQAERIIRLETKMEAILDSVSEIKAILRQPRP